MKKTFQIVSISESIEQNKNTITLENNFTPFENTTKYF